MLVLTRKPGGKLVIDGGIVLTVLEVRGNQVRIGIEAPLDVPIMRSELVPAAPVQCVGASAVKPPNPFRKLRSISR